MARMSRRPEYKKVYVVSVTVKEEILVRENGQPWTYDGPGSTDHEAQYTMVVSESKLTATAISGKLLEHTPNLTNKDQELTNLFVQLA
jgi:hypothetical protein